MLLRLTLIIMCVYCTLALVVLVFRSRGGNPRSAAWLILGVIAWHVGIRLPFILTLDTILPAWMSMLILGGTWTLGIGCLLFAAYYPYRHRWISITACAIALLGTLWIGYLLSLPVIIDRWQLFGILLQPQRALPPLILWVLLCLSLPTSRFIYHAFRMRGYQRLQIRYVLCGHLILVTGLLMNLFLCYRGTLIPILHLPMLIQGLGIGILAYSFSQLPLLDGKVALRFTITVATTLVIFTLCVVRLDITLTLFFINTLQLSPLTGTIIADTAFSLTFLLLMYFIGRVVDRYLLRSPYNERKVAAEISEALMLAVDVETVITRLTSILNRTIKPATVGCYLPDEASALVRLQPPTEADDLPAQLDAAGPLLDAIRRCRTVQLAELLLQRGGDDAASGRLLLAQGIRVVVPLWREHAWHGCLLLGEKASGDAYTAADTFLLQTISAQTSLALENVRSHEELLNLNTELEDRITKRTQELANANAQLRAADSAKDRFLAIVSHELVNPLTSIIAWAEVGRYSDEDRIIRRAFDIIKQSGEQQNHLVRDLLDTSRMIHGKLVVRLQPADLWQVLEQTLDDFVHRMREKQLKMIVLPPAQPMYSRIDPERMPQVISNLLANAVKFTEPGGVITVRGWHDATGNSITVQDTGKGIPAEKLTSIFQLFQQGTDDEFKGGLGLGLALVDGIMRLQGGTVTASSPGLGQGSTFTLTLPVVIPPDDFDLPDEDVCLEEPLLSGTSAFETVK